MPKDLRQLLNIDNIEQFKEEILEKYKNAILQATASFDLQVYNSRGLLPEIEKTNYTKIKQVLDAQKELKQIVENAKEKIKVKISDLNEKGQEFYLTQLSLATKD